MLKSPKKEGDYHWKHLQAKATGREEQEWELKELLGGTCRAQGQGHIWIAAAGRTIRDPKRDLIIDQHPWARGCAGSEHHWKPGCCREPAGNSVLMHMGTKLPAWVTAGTCRLLSAYIHYCHPCTASDNQGWWLTSHSSCPWAPALDALCCSECSCT